MNSQSSDIHDLSRRQCKPCEGGSPPLARDRIAHLLNQLSGWSEVDDEIVKTYQFKYFYQRMAFVNAVAWVANSQNHHPDMEVGYNRCRISYCTHAVGGLTENDFICAARIDALLDH